LRQLVAHAHAQNVLAVVVTFDPHPDSVRIQSVPVDC
jgi:FAD synthase